MYPCSLFLRSCVILILFVNLIDCFTIKKVSPAFPRKHVASLPDLFAQIKNSDHNQNPSVIPLLKSHPLLVTGNLENGLEFLILPNESPRGRFESYLEILSGSVDELENQQGMAHVVEHVAYMGSRNRILLGGTGQL